MEGISPTRLRKDRLPYVGHLFPFRGLLSRYKASMDVAGTLNTVMDGCCGEFQVMIPRTRD